MPKIKDNAYYKLVEDLVSNELSLSIVQVAVKESIRRDPEVPEGVKNLVATYGDTGTCVIDICFRLIKKVVGEMELAYRRGIQDGEERNTRRKLSRDKIRDLIAHGIFFSSYEILKGRDKSDTKNLAEAICSGDVWEESNDQTNP